MADYDRHVRCNKELYTNKYVINFAQTSTLFPGARRRNRQRILPAADGPPCSRHCRWWNQKGTRLNIAHPKEDEFLLK